MLRVPPEGWANWLAALGDPWLVPEERLAEATRLALAASPAHPEAAPVAAVLAARQRLHATLEHLDAEPLARAVARLEAELLPAALPERGTAAVRLAALSLARRYGDEPDVAQRLVRAARGGGEAGVGGWLGAQTAQAAAWALLARDDPAGAAEVLVPWPAAGSSWVGWLVTGRPVTEEATWRAYAAEQAARRAAAALRLVAPLGVAERADEPVAWWSAEAAGWRLVAGGGEVARTQLRRSRPPVLTGEP